MKPLTRTQHKVLQRIAREGDQRRANWYQPLKFYSHASTQAIELKLLARGYLYEGSLYVEPNIVLPGIWLTPKGERALRNSKGHRS